jgi:NADP-dependent 3-hydroxy acid dehydrogenase YdfG
MKKLKDQIVVITGVTSGIGLEISLLLLKEQAIVYMIGRNFQKLRKIISNSYTDLSNINFIQADITKDQDIDKIVKTIKKENKIDYLIHGAGVISIGLMLENPIENLDRQYMVNVRAPYLITQKLLPQIKNANGEIIFLNSTAGIDTKEGQCQYSATKFALKAIADCLRKEVKKDSIKVLSIYIGGTASPMQKVVQESKGNVYDPENFMPSHEIAEIVLLELKKSKTTMITDMTIKPNL